MGPGIPGAHSEPLEIAGSRSSPTPATLRNRKICPREIREQQFLERWPASLSEPLPYRHRHEHGHILPAPSDKLRALAQARLQKFAEASPRILNGPRLHHQLPTCCQISLVVPRDVRKAAPGRSGASRGLERVNSQREML